MDELIRRKEALSALLYVMCGTGYQTKAMNAIRTVPAIPQPMQPKYGMGRWIHRKNWDRWVCSECSSEEKEPRNYCPECGVRMEGKESQ